ncbi:MAG: sugar phosphate isomerase/epimerase [Clostridia bacterium]|nr:sugar phosphate isomerase/epimerase [Clostridia bacterium]
MKFGIESAAYLERYPFLEGVEKMARHGYDAVDYGYFAKINLPFFRQDEDAFRSEIERHRDILGAFHIEPSQTHGPWTNPPVDSTPEEREERFRVMSKAVRGSAYLGAKYMVIHQLMPFGNNSPESPDAVYEINLDFMYRLAEYGKEWGVIVCLENMPFRRLPMARPDEVAAFVRTVNHKHLKVCLDTGHALVRGIQPAEAVRMTGGDLLATLHIHDNDGTSDAHRPVGEGIMDFPLFVKALDEIGYRGVISLETMADRENALSPEVRDIAERQLLQSIQPFFK